MPYSGETCLHFGARGFHTEEIPWVRQIRHTINPVDSTDPYTKEPKRACAPFEISRRSKLPSQTIDISGFDQQETRPPFFDHLKSVLKLSILTFVSLFVILDGRHEAFWILCGAIMKNKLWRIRARCQLSQVRLT